MNRKEMITALVLAAVIALILIAVNFFFEETIIWIG